MIITFREVLEMSLIVGILLSYLKKINRTEYNKVVYLSIVYASIISIISAILFFYFAGGFTGVAEEIFEGVVMLIGSVLLTTMILWMMNQKNVARSLEQKLHHEISESHKFGIFFVVFISILREGIELVIFLGAASLISEENNLIGALIGLFLALLMGYLIFTSSRKINIKNFFTITSLLLILFAAGLLAHGIHELQEAGIVLTVVEHVWNINPPLNPDGTFPLLHENGYIGNIFKGLFGYNGNPSLIEVIAYVTYLIFAFAMWKHINKKSDNNKN